MYYSLIGFLAILILFITNYDVLLKPGGAADEKVQGAYRRFLFGVMAYYITDLMWGILDSFSLRELMYLDTEFYFIAMGLGILFWTKYVIAYLGRKNVFATLLKYAGNILFAFMCLLVLANLVMPILFWIDDKADYRIGWARYTVLISQIVLHLFTCIYALYVSSRSRQSTRSRHLVIGLAGLMMIITLSIQIFYPLIPLYTIGYMLAICLLRTFVIEHEKSEYQTNLEAALSREKSQISELNSAWKLAYTDALTGVRSKLAYAEKEEEVDTAIANGAVNSFAVAVFDLNGLKQINDTLGHEVGDRYIKSASRLICETFGHSPVFRIGGDEFVVILEGDDYKRKDLLMLMFHHQSESHLNKENEPVIAAGIAIYMPGEDNSFERVFKRADREMYRRKDELKKLAADQM